MPASRKLFNTVYARRLKKKQCDFVVRDFDIVKGASESVSISVARHDIDAADRKMVAFDAIQMAVQPLFAPSFYVPVHILNDGIFRIDFNRKTLAKMNFLYAPYTVWVVQNGKKKIFMQGKLNMKKGSEYVKASD